MGAGLKARNLLRKKYPLIISDERVSLSHLNLMTLAFDAGMCFYTCKHCYSENGLRALAYAVRLINST